VKQWLGPRRLTMRIERYDTEYGFCGSFHEVRADELIV
jgi:hypothetical protein